jgi:integrase
MLYQRGKQRIWWYRFRFGGRMVHESTKTTSKTLARDAERHRRRELEEKWNRVEKRKLPPTLNEASKRWLTRRAGLATGTRVTYEAALKHLRALLGSALVCEIEATDVVAYQKVRLSKGTAGATINKELACLSSILREYGIWEQIRRDVKRLDENDPGRALEREEERMLLQNCSHIGVRQRSWTPLYTVTVLGLNTGLRHQEIRTLRWINLDLGNRVLKVGDSKTEAGRGRPVPLTHPAWAALDIWASRFPNRRPEHFVFPACENGHVHPDRPIANWRTAWRRATNLIRCPACGVIQNPVPNCINEDCNADIRKNKSSIAGLRFHDLRHTAATKLLEHGAPFAVVAQILGWSASTAVRMAKRYGHIRPEVQRQALEAITTAEIDLGVNQIVHQEENALSSLRAN